MNISSVTLYRYSIPFTELFVTSQQTFAERTGLVLQAVTDTGLSGLGEIAPLHGFSVELLDDCTTAALALVPKLIGLTVSATPLELVQQMGVFKITYPSVAFGFELMLADLAAQCAGVPLSHWCRNDAATAVSVNAVLSGNDVDSQAAAKLEAGYRTFKLKIGSQTLAEDFRRIESARSVIGIDSKLRLDGNRAFDLAAARSLLRNIETFNVEYIEEPLKDPTLELLAKLRSDCSVPIAIDETLLEHVSLTTDARELVARWHDSHDVAILKPTLMGSINNTLRLAEALQQAGKKVVITSSLDTGIGIAAALHIACALQLETACGLDTGSGLSNQLIESPLIPARGRLAIPAAPGLGAILSQDLSTQVLLTILYAN